MKISSSRAMGLRYFMAWAGQRSIQSEQIWFTSSSMLDSWLNDWPISTATQIMIIGLLAVSLDLKTEAGKGEIRLTRK